MLPKRVLLGWAGLCWAGLGCHASTPEAEPRVLELPGIPLSEEEVFALGLVEEDWAGAALGIGIGQWSALGPINWKPLENMQSDFEAAVAQAEQVPEAEAVVEEPTIATFLVADVASGEAYFVAMDPDEMAVLGAAVEAEEAENPPQAGAWGDGVEARGTPDFGLSNGPDVKAAMRSLLPNASRTQHPWRTMGARIPSGGSTDGLCTGTLIGSKSVLTAAHCIVTYGQGNYQDWYPPGNYGWWIAKYGTEACYYNSTIDKMFVPAQVVQASQGTYWYYAYDYALVYLVNTPTKVNPEQITGCPTTPGWMSKTWVGESYIGTYSYRHDGYPDCTDPAAPPSCVTNGHYESFWISAVHDGSNTVSEDGLRTVVKHDGTTSPGHSGGPLWYYRGGTTPTVVGTHVGGVPSPGYTKVFRRLTPTSLNLINSWQCIAGPCI